MNKRQRKKNRVGEFAVYGFEVEAILCDASAYDEVIWNSFITFVEDNHFCFGGGIGPAAPKKIFGFVTGAGPERNDRGWMRDRSCTEEDRALIINWLLQHPKVESATTGPLVDAWR